MKNKFLFLLSLVLSIVLLAACGGSDSSKSSNGSKSAAITPDAQQGAVNKYPNAPKLDVAGTANQDMDIIERSFINTGNTERMQNFLNKAASGEPVTVAFIGGSITYGYKVNQSECFATLYCNWLTNTFNTEVKCVNAGISGTPSVLGNLRVERDVLAYDPDLVVIEFAVNDGGEDSFKNSYESLINKVLNYETEPAVMLLFCITRDGHSCESWMSEIGKHYSLPMISVISSMQAEVDAGHISYDDYSSDETHPNVTGHKWICDYLSYATSTIYNSDFETNHYELPKKPFYKRYYEAMKLYDNTNLEPTSLGSWSTAQTLDSFPNGFKYSPGTENKELSFTADCRGIIILYHEMPKNNEDNWGAVDVYVDGDLVNTIYSCSESGWNNPTYSVTYETVKSESHTITIKAKEGYEDKNFEILGIGLMQ